MSGSWISYFQSSYSNKSPWNQPSFTKIRAKYSYFILLLGKKERKEKKIIFIAKEQSEPDEEMEQRDGWWENTNIVFLLDLLVEEKCRSKTRRAEVYPHLSLSLPFLFFNLQTVDRGIEPSQPGDPMKFWQSGSISTFPFSIHTLFQSTFPFRNFLRN